MQWRFFPLKFSKKKLHCNLCFINNFNLDSFVTWRSLYRWNIAYSHIARREASLRSRLHNADPVCSKSVRLDTDTTLETYPIKVWEIWAHLYILFGPKNLPRRSSNSPMSGFFLISGTCIHKNLFWNLWDSGSSRYRDPVSSLQIRCLPTFSVTNKPSALLVHLSNLRARIDVAMEFDPRHKRKLPRFCWSTPGYIQCEMCWYNSVVEKNVGLNVLTTYLFWGWKLIN